MPNYMDLKEFRTAGFLQEANRLFFHPHGLALELSVDDNGEHRLTGVWDYREDPEGMLFGDSLLDIEKARRVRDVRIAKKTVRSMLPNCDSNGIQKI